MTLTDSLPLSALLPPADPAERLDWLDAQADAYSAEVTAALRRSLRAALAVWRSLTAALADEAADAAQAAWLSDLPTLVQPLAGMYDSGALAAWVGQTAPVDPEPWRRVVNTEGVDYMRSATNRLVNVADTTWHDVRSKVAKALSTTTDREALKKEIEAVAGFSEYRADTIARTEVMGAFNSGHLAGADAFGDYAPSHKQWVSTHDGRTREDHAHADQQVVPRTSPFMVGGWPLQHPGDPNGPAAEVINCRCTMLLLYPGDEALGGQTIEGDLPTFAPPPPPEWQPEPFTVRLTPARSQPSLGGAHAKTVYDGDDGHQYLFKPMPADLAHLEAATSRIGQLGGLDVPTVQVHTINGETGSIQRMIPNARNAFPGNSHQFDPTKVSQHDLDTIQRHRALDWLISNHDSHAGQWVRPGYASQGAHAVGIDKGQAFKYFGKDKLDFNYHPNASYGEAHPVHNLVERAYAEGRLDPKSFGGWGKKSSALQDTALRLKAIPDNEYKAMLRPYARARQGANAESWLDAAVKRKNDLDGEFRRYHDRLYNANLKVRKAQAGPAPDPFKPSKGGPKGMKGANHAEANLVDMERYDHPIKYAEGPGAAIKEYTGSAFRWINSALRNKTGEYRHLVEGVKKGLMKPKAEFYAYRGVDMANRMPGHNPANVVGGVFHDRGFLSTSIGKEGSAFDGDCSLIIRVGENAKGAYVKPISNHSSEREFLLDQNSHLYVHRVTEWATAPSEVRKALLSEYPGLKARPGRYVVEVEVVDETWAASQGLKVWDTNNGVWAT